MWLHSSGAYGGSRTQGISLTQMLIQICGEGQREESDKALTWGVQQATSATHVSQTT